MELAHALEHRRLRPLTPYKADAWELALQRAGLIDRFPSIPTGLRHSFDVGYPVLSRVQIPPNSTSLAIYEPEFKDIVDKELTKDRYIGPFPFFEIEASLGPFQSSPLSLIPKSGKPGKFHLIQNFSFPIEVLSHFPNPSINQAITRDFFPCTWGKFSTIYLLISRLSIGSQIVTRDVAEAYRTIPLHKSQWPAAVVQVSDTMACIDTCIAFGASPSCGAYGHVADAGAEILCAHGISPLDKWVDDHLFFRIPREHLLEYNASCYDLSFLFLHRSSDDSLSYRTNFLSFSQERLTPKRGFHCSMPRMALLLSSHGHHLSSCVTSYTAFFFSIAQTTFPLISVLAFLP